MVNRAAPKDIIIPEQLEQLLAMNEQQRAQLAHLSTIVDANNKMAGDGGSPASVSTYGGSGAASTYGGSGSGHEQSNSAESPESSGPEGLPEGGAKFRPPPGLSPGQTIDPGESACAPEPSLPAKQTEASAASQQLERATDMLKAALANWEACLQNQEVKQALASKQKKSAQAPPALNLPPSTPAKIETDWTKSLLSQSPADPATDGSAEQQQSAAMLNALQKALSGLAGMLPADTADGGKATQNASHNEGQLLRAQIEHGGRELVQQQHQNEVANAISEQVSEQAMKLFKQHLEKEQEENMQKYRDQMTATQAQQNLVAPTPLNALATAYAPGAGLVDGAGMWPAAALGLTPSPAIQGPPDFMPPGPLPFPPAAMGPMPGAFGMGMPWDLQAAMLCNTGSPGIQPDIIAYTAAMLEQGQHWQSGSKPSVPQNGRTQRARSKSAHRANRRSSSKPAKKGPNKTSSRKKNILTPADIPEDETLRTNLHILQNVDADRVILVRKINRLGFESPATLEAHYSVFGKVERVLVAHSHVKSQNRSCGARLRPSGLGFMIMSKKEEADAILAVGLEQIVRGVNIKVQSFRQHTADGIPLGADDPEPEGQEAGDVTG